MHSGQTILDVASPKLPAVYYARHGAAIHITDIRDYFFSEIQDVVKGTNGVLRVEDARELSYTDDYFDLAFSISVLEHIPDNGDSLAISEMARVLKPGGFLAVTVPFRRRYLETATLEEVYERDYSGEPNHWSRYYDLDALYQRIIEPSGLEISRLDIYRESFFQYYRAELGMPDALRSLAFLYTPLMAQWCLRRIPPIDFQSLLGQPSEGRLVVKNSAEAERAAISFAVACILLHKPTA
jgi:SAM-dependent methyltransferase